MGDAARGGHRRLGAPRQHGVELGAVPAVRAEGRAVRVVPFSFCGALRYGTPELMCVGILTGLMDSHAGVSEEQMKEFDYVACRVPGGGGPVKTTVPWVIPGAERMFFGALQELGVEDARAPYDGDVSFSLHDGA